jgi:hypothetical protein
VSTQVRTPASTLEPMLGLTPAPMQARTQAPMPASMLELPMRG